MKSHAEERKHRLSLILIFSGIVLLFFIVTTAIVSVVIVFLIYHGTLTLGDTEITVGTFILNFILWSLIIGAALAVVTSRFPLKPLNSVLTTLNRLASGDYSARLVFKGFLSKNPTITELSNSFNTMASELEQTELLRSDFINNFSHEFKTPIVSIAGFAKLLKRGNLPPEKQMEYLDVIEEESLRLSQMASNVLSLTKVESQNILTDVRTFNLSEQIRTCILTLERKWSKKHVELLLPLEEYFIDANEELMKQVWINLLDNAIKFSPDYGTIEAQIQQEADSTRVRISNLGEPIPKEKIDKIFKKFYQADESHSAEGNGVGLAVVKKIVDLHEGSVDVNCNDGKTTFTVFIPQRKS